jgi:hypothetical protein
LALFAAKSAEKGGAPVLALYVPPAHLDAWRRGLKGALDTISIVRKMNGGCDRD